ncbi:MAG TPA: VCBS repeat-containing protein [Chloroflexota bacterium]|nr:VCBS repeat-containing protein [Chloroflexota bacterium]HUM67544.1 VCBS repeat-containing protein [Chloroflexota bacterium]
MSVQLIQQYHKLTLVFFAGLVLISCGTQTTIPTPINDSIPTSIERTVSAVTATKNIISSEVPTVSGTTHPTSTPNTIPQIEGCPKPKNHYPFQVSEEVNTVLQDIWFMPSIETAEGELAYKILDYMNEGGNINNVMNTLELYDLENFSLSPKAVWVDLDNSGFNDLVLVTSRGLWIFNCVSGVYRLGLVYGFLYHFDLELVKVEDINGDGLVDLFISGHWIGSSCELLLVILSWNGEQFINLFNPGERLLPANNCPADFELTDLNDDNFYEIVVMAWTSRFDSESIRNFKRVYELDESGYYHHAYTEYP